MESIQVTVPINPSVVGPGAYLLLYSGPNAVSIDYNTPIAGPIEVYPASIRETYHNITPHNDGPHNGFHGHDAGHNCGVHNVSPHNGAQDTVTWRGGLYYGPSGGSKTIVVAAKIYDYTGKADAGNPTVVASLCINTFPRPPASLQASSLAGGVMTFTFQPSPDLP